MAINRKKERDDQEAEAKINLAYAKAAGVKPMDEMPEFADFAKEAKAAAKKDNLFRTESKRMIEAEKKRKAKK